MISIAFVAVLLLLSSWVGCIQCAVLQEVEVAVNDEQHLQSQDSPTKMPSLTPVDSALETVYFVRHCDKVSEGLPCCSDLGYQRAEAWGPYFHDILATLSSSNHASHRNLKRDMKVQDAIVYSALADYGGHKSKLCRADLPFSSKKGCQKSQRLVMTALLLHDRLLTAPTSSSITRTLSTSLEMKYCAADSDKALQDILHNNANHAKHAIVVWSREGIVDMLQSLNFDISDWPKNLEQVYNLVFRLDVRTGRLTFNCVDFQRNSADCDPAVATWLQGI